MPKKSMRTYFPASLFASSLVIGMCSLAIPYKWWSVKGGWKGKILNDSSFIFWPLFDRDTMDLSFYVWQL